MATKLFTDDDLRERGILLLYHSGHILGIVPQTLVYGMYASLIPISTYIMLKRGLKTKMRKFLFGMSLFMFVLTTVYWVLSFVTLIRLVQVLFFDLDSPQPDFLPMWNAIVLMNYVLTDGVVVWRAWVLCQDQTKVLWFAIFFLVCCACSVTATIIIRIMLYIVVQGSPIQHHLTRAIDITQVANLVLSILTNIISTSTISLKAWRIRRQIKHAFSSSRNRRLAGSRVIVLLVESGVIYCLSCITVLVSTLIPLRDGTLGDIYTPVNVQLAGMYPVVVLLLVSGEYSLEQTEFVSTGMPGGRDRASREPGISVQGVDYRRDASRLETIRFRTVGTLGMEDSTGSTKESTGPNGSSPDKSELEEDSERGAKSQDVMRGGDIRVSVSLVPAAES